MTVRVLTGDCRAVLPTLADVFERVQFVIEGECVSKANSRELVTIAGHPSFIKSKKALAWWRDAMPQIPAYARRRFTGRIRMRATLFYATERPDLDESLLLDVLQDQWTRVGAQKVATLVQSGVYRNDRQVRERHVVHAIDARRPRAEVVIEALEAQQETLL
jgi:Holliday junction resolvase RusA-like endonuclease